ncbi:hypothetical protein PTKIN_Ptkin09bG0148300 [Pterospermum kingtungense]
MLICGAFNHQEEDDVDQLWNSPNSTPRKSRRNSFCKRHNKDNNKNPYSNRGLDKFSALLAELEEKRRQIYSQTGSQDISFVRFKYKNSTECVPIVVKLKDKKEEEKKKPVDTKDHHQPGTNSESEVLDKHTIQTLIEDKVNKNTSGLQQVNEKTDEKKKQRFSWNKELLHKWRRPSYYLPAFLVLILLLLVFFGRSVSILFTCIGWYIVPIIQGESSNKVRRSMKKKDFVRKLSENKFGAVRDKSSPVRDHH